MPKKKQVIFQGNIPGKFIPRDDTPSTSVFRSGTNANRFNSKMAELLASSSSTRPTGNNENEPVPTATKPSQDATTLSPPPDMATIDSSRVHSKLLHRRIVTMLETLRRRGGNSGSTSPPTSPRLTPGHIESKSQPITFGQLRQATSSPPPPAIVVEEASSSKVVTSTRSYTDLMSMNTSDRQSYHTSVITDPRSDSIPLNKSSPKHPTNKERLFYSPSLEHLLEQHHVPPRMTEPDEIKQEEEEEEEEEEESPKLPLTVDEILATYYSKVKVPTTTETKSSPPLSSYPNSNMGFYIHPSSSGWNSPQINQHHISSPQLLLNEQKRNRPPPPSYSSSIASGHRPPTTTANNLAQHLIRSPVRAPPPRYESPTSNIERSHSALSSMNRPNYSQNNPPQAGFDREFSRLLYGKDGGKNRHQRQKRKAFSDPVKKSVEEAGRSVEKTHRRLTTHLNKTDTVTEEEENGSDSNEIDKHEQNSFPRRHFPRPSNHSENNRDSTRKPIVPANPLLKRRIPSFLRVYSQASSSSDILLQWHLFSSSELESLDAMMKKLYKDENLSRVQIYENYRALLSSTLTSKTSMKINPIEDDDNGITTTAL